MRARTIILGLIAGIGLSAHAAEDPARQQSSMTFVPEVAKAAAAEGSKAFEGGDFTGARKAFSRVLDLAPDNLLAIVNLGAIEFRAKNYPEAERLLKQAVSQRVETAPAWLTLGMMYYEQNKLDEAHAALAQAVLYDSKNPRAHSFLGAVMADKGWYDAAEACMRRSVELDPANRDSHYNLAVLYMQRTPPLPELAKRHYFRAIELGAPTDPKLEKSIQTAPR
jgi:tetratricopeptide (TPR) repeat protein